MQPSKHLKALIMTSQNIRLMKSTRLKAPDPVCCVRWVSNHISSLSKLINHCQSGKSTDQMLKDTTLCILYCYLNLMFHESQLFNWPFSRSLSILKMLKRSDHWMFGCSLVNNEKHYKACKLQPSLLCCWCSAWTYRAAQITFIWNYWTLTFNLYYQ